MRSIQKILAIKGDKPFLSVTIAAKPGYYFKSIIVEGGGSYKGYDYLITFTRYGFRCGYVEISPGHPLYKKNSDKINIISCNYGVTYFDKPHYFFLDLIGEKKTSCDDKWIGFDCGHYFDSYDIEASKKYFDLSQTEIDHIKQMSMSYELGTLKTLKTLKYVENECKNIIDQII